MFRGFNSINLDAKGRLAIPTRFRGGLKESCDCKMVVTVAVNEKGKGEDGCLWLYPLPEWDELEKKLSGLPTLNKSASRVQRFLIGHAEDCEMDGQGRLLIPEQLRTLAGLDKHIVILGRLKKFEIWSQNAWDKKQQDWMSDDGDDDSADLEDISTLSF